VARIGRRYVYILPTGFGVLLGVVLALMLLGSLNYQNNLALLFTFLMGSVALIGMHHTWFNLLGLQVSARGGSPVFAGQEATFGVTLSSGRRRARPDLAVRIAAERSSPVTVEPGASATVAVRLPTRERGLTGLEEVSVETRHPLGLFRAWCRARTDARVLVYPRPATRSPAPAPVPAHRPSDQGDLGVGADEFVGPRDYRPGDSPRRLDWKALARERGLVVKQFGGDRAARVWVDWERLPPADTETRIGLLCRQVLDAAESGLDFGLRLPGRTIPVGHGDVHQHRCLEALATFGHE
jgi:uncharacterized protein (DUF58 family)